MSIADCASSPDPFGSTLPHGVQFAYKIADTLK